MEKIANPADPVLIIDDDEFSLGAISLMLERLGVTNVETCSESREATQLFLRNHYSLILLDLLMPVVSGWDLLPVLTEKCPDTPFVVLTGRDDLNSAITCMKAGAFDYILKPCNKDRLAVAVGNALELASLRQAGRRASPVSTTASRTDAAPQFSTMVTRDARMTAVFDYVRALAPSSFPVLITGETGTGKELLARSLHEAGGRSGRLVAVNVAGLDDTLFSDTLFGHKRGAFTGAQSDRQGMLARAEDGTLFLDEIGDLSAESQIRLLRLLQERVYFPLGSDEAKRTSARFVFATNHDLDARMEAGTFRSDLYYRLEAHHVQIPPLRERSGDLPLLIEHFLRRGAASLGKPVPSVPNDLYDLLRAYDFPGNIRELEGMVNDALVRHDGPELSLDRFRSAVFGKLTHRKHSPEPETGNSLRILPGADGANPFSSFRYLPSLEEADAALVAEALHRSGGNQTAAARTLGISRQALNNRLRRARTELDTGRFVRSNIS